jgi:hypothetical protein
MQLRPEAPESLVLGLRQADVVPLTDEIVRAGFCQVLAGAQGWQVCAGRQDASGPPPEASSVIPSDRSLSAVVGRHSG